MKKDDYKSRDFKQVDVFTSIPCFGNPLAVVTDAHGLNEAIMQQLARWTNLSETAFIFEDPEVAYHLRIFSLDREVPFAGHPTIGAAHAAIEAGLVGDTEQFQIRCRLGLLNMRTEDQNIWVQVPLPFLEDVSIDKDELSEALKSVNLIEPLVYNTGPIWIVARLGSESELDRVKVDQNRLATLSRNTADAVGIILYAFNPQNGIDVRAFAPAVGVSEDPVCGSGNIAAAAHLRQTGELEKIGTRYQARQGRHMGRNGTLHLVVNDDFIELGGESVTVVDGAIRI